MNLDRPTSQGKTVEATATNRPIKIAYLVPFDDSAHTHLNLDAVFFESYTRWAGVYTLVVPTLPHEFHSARYDEWLQRYDPDFVYSYVDLDTVFIDRINRLCCPIALLKHEMKKAHDSEIRWRSFLPHWEHYIQPVSSVSTIQSPASFPRYLNEPRSSEPTILTQYAMQPSNRFLADNFGTGFNLTNVIHAIPGFFRTLCLVPAGLSERMVAGSERCHSPAEAFRAITDRKAISIAQLAMTHSAGMPRPETLDWAFAFRLFVGTTAIDRIHFWNCRHLGNSWSETTNAMIVEPSFFDDDQLVKQLGQYLNKNNFLGRSNGHYQVEIHSSSVVEDALHAFKDKLASHTWNEVRVTNQFNALVQPSSKDLEGRVHERATDSTTLKLAEDANEVVATPPAHFAFLSPQRLGHARGQWIVELEIQRHNNLSRFSNVIDAWKLPRRRKIVSAFTRRLAKPTHGGQLALVPSTKDFPLQSPEISRPSHYEIYLPSDADFFRHLALEFFRYPSDDLRALVPEPAYVDLAISDKGQNLRGVISLFDSLSTASAILTKRYWREVLAKAPERSVRPLAFDWSDLHSIAPNDLGTIRRLTDDLGFEKNETLDYIRAGLMDTLDHLVRSNVFYQVAQWRCAYCGHANSRSFDNMKRKNECDICATTFIAPIDMPWRYELSAFVHRSLKTHCGLPVLWTLGKLQERSFNGAFWYLPEVDLFEKDDDPASKNEIDILCMLDGEFFAAEVKLSASTFINNSGAIDKFVKVVELLRPDVALLAFERYCAEEANEQETKTRLAEAAKVVRARIGPWVKLEILVAQDIKSFNEFSGEFGWHGPRMRNFN